MKKLLTTVMIIGSMIGLSHAALIDDAVSWMRSESLTIFNNTLEYKPNNIIRRDEAAKLFVMFAGIMNKTEYVKSIAQCQFDDLYAGHRDLADVIIQACRYGIFLGYNNKFNPTQGVTNEQALAVVIRILYGKQDETNVTRRSDNYYKKANEYNLLNNVTMTNKGVGATRGNVGIVLYNASGKNSMGAIDNIHSLQNYTTGLIQYTPAQADWNTFNTKPFEKDSNISQAPDGIKWITPAQWENAKWDGTIYDPSKMTKQEFYKAIFPYPDVVRGLREVFYKTNPFLDVKNPTKAEVDEWHRIAINHIRALVGYTSEDRKVQKDTCLFARSLWSDMRMYTTAWDVKYPGKVDSAYGPCQGTNNPHCGASFVPSPIDQVIYLLDDHSSCSNSVGGSEGISSAPKSNIPWSIKWVRALGNFLQTEGFWGGHVGPWFHREKFGFSFWDQNPKDYNSNAILRAKWSGQLKSNLYKAP